MPYITPNSIPAGRICRPVFIPDDPEWMAIVSGALNELAFAYNWEQVTGISAQDAAAVGLEMWLAHVQDECASDDVPTPYWTNADNVDDSLPADVQEWYGFFTDYDASWDDMSFVEQATVWLYSGMIASAYSPGAAIVFRTTVSKFLFAVRQRDFGGIVRLMIDGDDVATIDTSESPDTVTYIPVVGDPDVTEHEFRVINVSPDGVGAMELHAVDVVRKLLSENEITPPDRRYNQSTDAVEFSPDGGTTWVDAPWLDPRSSDIFRRPALPDGERCNAAARMRAQIEQQMDTAIAFQSVAGIASSFLFGLGLLTAGIGTLVGLFLLVADTLLTIGIDAIITAMTASVYDQLECILFCNIDDNGQMSEAQLAQIRADVNDQIGGVAAVVLNLMFDSFGSVNLSNAAVVRDESGDCEDCECLVDWGIEFDFAIEQYGWALDPGYAGKQEYAAGVGFRSTGVPDAGYNFVYINRTLDIADATLITRVEADVESSNFDSIYGFRFQPFQGGYSDPPSGAYTYIRDMCIDPYGIDPVVMHIEVNGQQYAGATAIIRRVRLYGTGIAPDIGTPIDPIVC